jgi:hypothetical protein
MLLDVEWEAVTLPWNRQADNSGGNFLFRAGCMDLAEPGYLIRIRHIMEYFHRRRWAQPTDRPDDLGKKTALNR